MRLRQWVLMLVLLLGAGTLLLRTIGVAAQPGSPRWSQTSVDDWNNGTLDGLLVTNNDGGELRLDPDSTRGVYTSAPFQATFDWNAAAVEWAINTPPSTSVRAELRTSPDGNEWREWQPLPTPQTISATLSIAGPLVAQPSRWLQYRLTMETQAAPATPEVFAASWLLLDSSDGPTLLDQPRRVIASAPAATLTRPPLVVPRVEWGAQPATIDERFDRARQFSLTGLSLEPDVDPLTFLRAIQTVSQSYGDTDLPYAYAVDAAGNVYEGRTQAPSSHGTLAIALLGEPTDAAKTALAQVLAWLSQSYQIPLALSVDGTLTPQMGEAIRVAADQATVRSRWLLAQNNTRDYTERLMLFNPTRQTTTARITFFPGQEQSSSQDVELKPGARANLMLNDVYSDTASIPIEVTANQTIVTERTMLFLNDSLSEPGIETPSRTWYFATGDTTSGHTTTVHMFNNQPADVAVSVLIYYTGGLSRTEELLLKPFESLEYQPTLDQPATFGMRIAASAPIAVERTMRFGVDSSGGFLSRGAPVPATAWYFAEGATIAPFSTTLALLNPSPAAAAITTTFMTEQGDTFVRRYQLPPRSRIDVDMRDIVPSPQGVGTTVTSSQPIVAERISLFNNGNAGTSTLGSTMLAYSWRFAEGRTAPPSDEFILIANPNNRSAEVRILLGKEDGSTQTLTRTVPRMGRIAVLLDNDVPDQQSMTTVVESNLPVVAERTILITNDAGTSGHTSLGTPER